MFPAKTPGLEFRLCFVPQEKASKLNLLVLTSEVDIRRLENFRLTNFYTQNHLNPDCFGNVKALTVDCIFEDVIFPVTGVLKRAIYSRDSTRESIYKTGKPRRRYFSNRSQLLCRFKLIYNFVLLHFPTS